MTSVGQAVDSVLARLHEAREAQAEQMGADLYAAYHHQVGEGRAPPADQAWFWTSMALKLLAKGYRKAAT